MTNTSLAQGRLLEATARLRILGVLRYDKVFSEAALVIPPAERA